MSRSLLRGLPALGPVVFLPTHTNFSSFHEPGPFQEFCVWGYSGNRSLCLGVFRKQVNFFFKFLSLRQLILTVKEKYIFFQRQDDLRMKLLFFLLLVFCSFVFILACRSLKGRLATAGREPFLALLVLSVPESLFMVSVATVCLFPCVCVSR